MPVPRGQTRDPTTDEGGPPSFLEDTNPNRNARPASSPTDDTVVRTSKAARVSSAPLEVPLPVAAAPSPAPAPSGPPSPAPVASVPAPASFDDEVAHRRVSA